MEKIPTHLKVTGMIGCGFDQWYKSANKCGRISLDAEVGMVPVASDAPDLSDAMYQAEVMWCEWSEVSEPICDRDDNFWKGERDVIVYRVGSYLVDRVYASEE